MLRKRVRRERKSGRREATKSRRKKRVATKTKTKTTKKRVTTKTTTTTTTKRWCFAPRLPREDTRSRRGEGFRVLELR